MRRLLLAVTAGLGASACAHADAEPAAVSQASKAGPLITVSEQSNVCVSVTIDQRIWPRPLDPDSAQIFSGSLMAELRILYERRGGSIRFPNSRDHRFVTNENGDDAECQDRDTDVFVVAHYGPRADGTAFIFTYRIERGAIARASRFEIDIAAEIRAGRIRGFNQRRTMTQVIYEDLLLLRTSMILDHLTIPTL